MEEKIEDLDSELVYLNKEIKEPGKGIKAATPVIRRIRVKPERKTREILRLNQELKRVDEELSNFKIKAKEETKLEKELEIVNEEINDIGTIKQKPAIRPKLAIEKQHKTREILRLNHEIKAIDREIAGLKSKGEE